MTAEDVLSSNEFNDTQLSMGLLDPSHHLPSSAFPQDTFHQLSLYAIRNPPPETHLENNYLPATAFPDILSLTSMITRTRTAKFNGPAKHL